jgi:ubiquinone biosynthesis protein UbiJ
MAEPTAFGALLVDLLARRALTQADFARLVGKAPGVVQFIRVGRRRPPLARIEAWADALALRGEDRRRFLEAARLEHCPPEIRHLVATLRRRVERMERQEAEAERRAAELRRGYRADP